MNEEIKQVIFDMTPWKSLEPDGYHVGFFQQSWNVVGNNVCSFVQDLWDNPCKIQEINQTDICFIPKVKSPDKVIQFRMKVCMDKVASPNLFGFIPNRNIHENIVVAQEIMYNMDKLKIRRVSLPSKLIWQNPMIR